MIYKEPEPEAPPSYQSALQGDSAYRREGKATYTPAGSSSSSSSPRLPFSRGSSSQSHGRRVPKPKPKPQVLRWTSIFGMSKTAKQVRSTTQSLLRDLLSQTHPSEHECTSVISSCSEACTAQGINFAALLQEQFVEGHQPLYWAILKRPAGPEKTDSAGGAPPPDPCGLVFALLTAAQPMNSVTVAEARLACMTMSDNALFDRLRKRYPEIFAPLRGTDAMLLGGDTTDSVEVEDLRGDAGAFIARFKMVQFQLRMRVSKSVKVEFIARGRLWYLMFSIVTQEMRGGPKLGAWLVTLGLCEHSPPTWVDSSLIIEDLSVPYAPIPLRQDSLTARRMSSIGMPPPPRHPATPPEKPRPTVCLPLKSGKKEVSPAGPPPHELYEIVVPLDKSLMGSSLQFEGSSYIDSDGTLGAQLEARLNKSADDSNCIIC